MHLLGSTTFPPALELSRITCQVECQSAASDGMLCGIPYSRTEYTDAS